MHFDPFIESPLQIIYCSIKNIYIFIMHKLFDAEFFSNIFLNYLGPLEILTIPQITLCVHHPCYL